MTSKPVALWVAVAIAAFCAGFGLTTLWLTPAPTSVLEQAVVSADKELAIIKELQPTVIERLEVVRYEKAKEVLCLDGDALANAGLVRAERFRRRLIASDDTARAARLDNTK